MKKLTQGENFSKQNTTSNIEKMRKYFDIYNACCIRINALIEKEKNKNYDT